MTSVDCGAKTCDLEMLYKDTCEQFFPSEAESCKIPCSFEGCKVEIHHNTLCPVWICYTKTTTTSTPPSSSTTIPIPIPDIPWFVEYLSYGTNILLLIILFSIALYTCVKKIKKCLRRRRGPEAVNPHQHFSLGGEQAPLLENEARQQRDRSPMVSGNRTEPSLSSQQIPLRHANPPNPSGGVAGHGLGASYSSNEFVNVNLEAAKATYMNKENSTRGFKNIPSGTPIGSKPSVNDRTNLATNSAINMTYFPMTDLKINLPMNDSSKMVTPSARNMNDYEEFAI